jgi:hypothetical protein
MKTHIIQLHEHDNVFSTKDKMVWCKEPRVLLVTPQSEKFIFSRVDLVRLLHHSRKLGIQLALVSTNSDLQQSANLAQVPVFESIEKAQRSTWRRRSTRKKIAKLESKLNVELLNHRRNIIDLKSTRSIVIRSLGFFVGMTAVVAMLVFFIPGAEITLPIARERQRLDMTVSVNPNISSLNIGGGIPAYIKDYEIEEVGQIQSTGMVTVPDQSATGEVVFTNLTDQVVEIPKGTIISTVSTPPVRFATVENLSVPTGKGPTENVLIQALETGAIGNVQPGEIVALEGAAGSKVTVFNPEATSGGSDRSVSGPSSSDYRLLRQKVEEELNNKALEYFKQSLVQTEKIVPGTLQQESIISENQEPPEGTPADYLKLVIKARYKIWFIKIEDVEKIAKYSLDIILPEGYIADDGVKLDFTDHVIPHGSAANWEINTSRLYHQQVPQTQIASILVGKRPSEASQILKDHFSLNSNPEISIFPGWWGRLTYIYLRIKIQT